MDRNASTTTDRWLTTMTDQVVFVRSATARDAQPDDWRERLSAFMRLTGVACVGAKRLAGNDKQHIFSMGEMVVHPKGYHHHGGETNFRCYRFPEEVDAIAGGVMAVDRKAFEAVNGAELLRGELGGVRLGLALRKAGYRVVTVPQVVVTDAHEVSPAPEEEAAFGKTWGFDWRAADMKVVRETYAGTGLLWNVRFHADAMPFDRYDYRPAPVWVSYQQAEVFRQRADHLCKMAAKLAQGKEAEPAEAGRRGQLIAPAGTLLEIGCGDGLFSHLIASLGVEVVGLDPEERGISQAIEKTKEQVYAGPRPRYMVGGGEKLPFEDGAFAAVCLFDVIEHLDNPVAVLREIVRVLRPGGQALLVTPMWQYGGWSDPMYHATEYTMSQLVNQISAVGGLTVTNAATIGGVYRDAVVTARKNL
ncbi:MAG: class I SAM-dependent methyltransferase [Phycisphaerales bacterium]